jgi:hypothetical protein
MIVTQNRFEKSISIAFKKMKALSSATDLSRTVYFQKPGTADQDL